ncbi:MAG: DM13 domain-containing protein [Chloroflexi bacterium]|nr:DM13 domain-containing protein [Chloroflexota bacterium]
MLSSPVLAPHRVDMLRHLFLALAAAAGMAASGYVLSSQAAADFLREGAVRFTGLEGETLRLVLGLGALAATGIAVGALWHQVTHPRLLLAAIALGGGMFLAHAVLMPMAVLLVMAAGTDLSQHVTRERFEWARRNPAVLGSGALAGAGALAAGVWISIWLLGPLFDEGTRLDEMLGFEVEGLVEPAAVVEPATVEPATVEPATAAPAIVVEPATVEPATAAPATVAEPTTVEPATAAPATVDPDAAEEGEAVAAAPSAPDAPTATEESVPAGEATQMDTPSVADAAADPAPDAERTGRLISSGILMGTDAFHTGSGDVLLVSDPDGNLILRFQEYSVRNGPDLFVYLTPDPEGDVHVDGAVNLGAIRATSGFVNYEVPADVDPASFRAAVIYCRAFSVTFAVAELT